MAAQSSSEMRARCVASRGTSVIRRTPLVSTTRAASGSAQMLNSADGVTFPTSWPPPMMTISGILSARRGSRLRAAPTLLNGPVGTRMISSVVDMYVSMRNSTAPWSRGRDVDGGMSRYRPWTSMCPDRSSRGRGKSCRTRGCASPAWTGIDAPRRSKTRSVFSVVNSRGTFPFTVVAATSSMSGCSAASISATASSVPVSTSRITRWPTAPSFCRSDACPAPPETRLRVERLPGNRRRRPEGRRRDARSALGLRECHPTARRPPDTGSPSDRGVLRTPGGHP